MTKITPTLPTELLETWTARIKADVLFFHTHTGMKLTTIGAKGIENARMWERLERGGTITLEKADELYAFFAAQGYHFKR